MYCSTDTTEKLPHSQLEFPMPHNCYSIDHGNEIEKSSAHHHVDYEQDRFRFQIQELNPVQQPRWGGASDYGHEQYKHCYVHSEVARAEFDFGRATSES